jgi:hypothetical protein
MSTSPWSPEDIRAAAEVHQELGPEYQDAVVASFLEKVDREIAARVEARLADLHRAEPAKQHNRRTLLKGMAIGAATVALVLAIGFGRSGLAASGNVHVAPVVHAPEVPAQQPPNAPAAP